jgi:hypothetical protein
MKQWITAISQERVFLRKLSGKKPPEAEMVVRFHGVMIPSPFIAKEEEDWT